MADLKHLIPVRATPDAVYALLATQRGLASWWTTDTMFEPKVGGKATFGFDRRETVFHMTVEQLDPGKRVVFTCQGDHPEWNGTTLTWTISPESDTTILKFTQSGWKAITDYAAGCNSAWGELMHRLRDSAEGRSPGPHWRE
jgi:uncharacterized protein YndB with AHSA1/START domain